MIFKHSGTGGVFEATLGDSGSCRAIVFNGKDYGFLRGSFYVVSGEFGRDDIKNNYQDHLRFDAELKKVDKKIENTVNEGIASKITIFDGDEDEYLTLTQEQKNNYLIAIVNPLAVLNEEEVSVLDDILLDSEPTMTIMNLTDEEIEAELDIIINGVEPIEEEV